jgi:hypothetical protein
MELCGLGETILMADSDYTDITIRYSSVQVGTGSNWTKISAWRKFYFNGSIQIEPYFLGEMVKPSSQSGLSRIQPADLVQVQVGDLSVWTQVSCGYNFSLALRSRWNFMGLG